MASIKAKYLVREILNIIQKAFLGPKTFRLILKIKTPSVTEHGNKRLRDGDHMHIHMRMQERRQRQDEAGTDKNSGNRAFPKLNTEERGSFSSDLSLLFIMYL